MRIAFCLSGQPRNAELGWLSLSEHILNVNNPDVFIHVWWDDSYNSDIGESYGMYPDTIHKIKELYKPTCMVVQKPIESFPDSNDELRKSRICSWGLPPVNTKYYYNLRSQWYSLNQSFEFKRDYERKNDFLYDVVIRGRFDLDIDRFPNLHKYKIRGNTSYMPTVIEWALPSDEWVYGNGVDRKYLSYNVFDSLGFGDSKTMDIYSKIGDHVDEVLKRHVNIPFIPECVLRRWLEDNEITINTMVDTNILLIREHGIRAG